ncbi:MAG: hypothetical protein GF383_05175 [Candidatus Lokiarchaeota archaeon]|nr:hypothetical protein [Candidatus Lokiarchaeota archaeon]MBD3339284.1 hypothetical protein [Candidatus Lokiarchaeota archaeon]
MEYTKADIFQAEAVMNQMRNAIYHLARFMKANKRTNVEERLRQMGRNIAKTMSNYWQPVDKVTLSNLKDFLTTVYQKILNSNISIEVQDNLLTVVDNKCALCKYHYEDIEIAGCEIILGLVCELVDLINKESAIPSRINLSPLRVEKSRAYGHSDCVQVFKIELGGN